MLPGGGTIDLAGRFACVRPDAREERSLVP